MWTSLVHVIWDPSGRQWRLAGHDFTRSSTGHWAIRLHWLESWGACMQQAGWCCSGQIGRSVRYCAGVWESVGVACKCYQSEAAQGYQLCLAFQCRHVEQVAVGLRSLAISRLRCWISNQCFGFCFHLCFLGNSDSKILIFAWSIALPYLGLEASKVSDGTLHCCSQAALVPPIWALFGEGRLQKGCVASSFGVLSLQWPQQTWPRNSVWEPYHFDVAMCCVERSI